MHPNCRSTTIAYIEGMEGKRIARGSDGKNYEVDVNMTYKDWYNNLSENEKGKMSLLNKKDRNASKDKLEYEKYKQVLGKEMPSLERFKDLKYNKDREYELIKGFSTAVDKGYVSALVGFKTYKNTDKELKSLVALKTTTGIEVKGHTLHFIDRVIGQFSSDEPESRKGRRGVDIEDIKEAIVSGRVGKTQVNSEGKRSIVFSGKRCVISINPQTEELIQTNPHIRRDVNDKNK